MSTNLWSNARVMKGMIAHIEKYPEDGYDTALTMCIALRIGIVFQEDAVVVSSPRYMAVELHRDWHNDPYETTLKAIVRVAKQVLTDIEAKENESE